jgi:hypothetical protein
MGAFSHECRIPKYPESLHHLANPLERMSAASQKQTLIVFVDLNQDTGIGTARFYDQILQGTRSWVLSI